jgi:hypothetical protein
VSAEAGKRLMRAIFVELETGKGALFAAALADNVVMRVTGSAAGRAASRARRS